MLDLYNQVGQIKPWIKHNKDWKTLIKKIISWKLIRYNLQTLLMRNYGIFFMQLHRYYAA